MVTIAAGAFGTTDWAVLAAYFALLVVTGWIFARRELKGADEYFLAGRQMPVWAVSISVLATSLSAATFIGGPQQAYVGDLTYLSANLGAVLAIVVVAVVFIPVYYRMNVTTVYGLLERRFGPGAKRAAAAMFLVGRIFASGARLFMVAIPASRIVFGDTETGHMVLAIVMLAAVATLYTLAGGIRSIIWTDVIQTCVFVGAAAMAAAVLLHRIPLDIAHLGAELASAPAPGGGAKATVLRLGAGDWSSKYTLLTALTGFALLNLGAYGTDHDLAQRMLTCRSAVRGSWSAIGGVLVGIPVTMLFMGVGLLLYVYYGRPDLMGAAAPAYAPPGGSEEIFLTFILHEMPAGMAGMMMAGLFAAGLGSTNSAINAMSATLVSDFYRPLRPGRSERHYLHAGRLGVVLWGAVLGAFACACVWWYKAARAQDQPATLIDFALGVMGFAYSGLVAVFLTAVLTRRGTTAGVIGALATGFAVVLAMQPWAWARWAALIPLADGAPGSPRTLADISIAYPWHLVIATALAMAVCMLPRGRSAAQSGPDRRHSPA
jgi:SSS family transporter